MKHARIWNVAALTGVVVLLLQGGCNNDRQESSRAPAVPSSAAPAASAMVAPQSGVPSAPVAASSVSQADGSPSPRATGFNAPSAITVDDDGTLYVADTGNNVIRRVSPKGEVTTLAGTVGVAGHADGTGTAATFDHPGGIAVDRAGNLYVADTGNNTIRKITLEGTVTTLAGSAKSNTESTDGIGAAARFEEPSGIAVDPFGNIYVADCGCAIRKITPRGTVTTLAGNLDPDFRNQSRDGTGPGARFNFPSALAFDKQGNLYVAEQGALRKVTPDGKVTTVHAVDQQIIDDNAEMSDPKETAAYAHHISPSSLAVNKRTGAVYFAEGSRIRVLTKDKNLATFTGGEGYSDGDADHTGFRSPLGLALDEAGNLYVADTGNNAIRKVTPDGITTTLAGSPQTAVKP